MQKITGGLFASLLLLPSIPASAHHPSGVTGSGLAGPIVTIPGTTLAARSFIAWGTFEYISLDELSNAALEAAAGRHEHVHSLSSIQSPMIGFAYGVTNRLTLGLHLPYVIRKDIREGEHHHLTTGATETIVNEVVNRGDAEGIGDLSLLGQYRLTPERDGLQASVLLGVKAPTGVTDERDAERERFETEFQPGSGSWDGVFGLAVTRSLRRWSLVANVLYTVAGEGSQHTDLGDRFLYNGAVSYRLIGSAAEAADHYHGDRDHGHYHHNGVGRGQAHEGQNPNGFALDAVLEANGEWQDKQNIAGEDDPNTGGDVVYLSPGVRLSSGRWSSFLSVGVPVINDLNGQQSEPNYRVLGGASLSF